LGLAVLSGLVVVGSAPPVGAAFAPDDLGSVGAHPSSAASDINEAGAIVGSSYGSGAPQGFLWTEADGLQVLDDRGGNSTSAMGINDLGQVVGTTVFLSPTGARATLWDPQTGAQDIAPGSGASQAWDINNLGQVVGHREGPTTGWFFWDPVTGIQAIEAPNGFVEFAPRLNEAGQVVGTARIDEGAVDRNHAFVWDPVDGFTDLGRFGGFGASASDINEAGQVAVTVTSSSQSQTRAFRWDLATGTRVAVGTLGGTNSFATGINDEGRVVGRSDTRGDDFRHGFRWDPATGMTDLGTLSGADSEANAINSSDVTVGQADYGVDDFEHAARWGDDPTPTVSIADARAYEGDTGKPGAISFSVTLTRPATTEVLVDYRVVPDTADETDIKTFDGQVRSVLFKPSVRSGLTPTTRLITIQVLPDVLSEGDENFRVELLGASGGVLLSDAEAIGTIVDGESGSLSRVSVGDVSIYEGDAGKGNPAKVWVSLSAPSAVPVTVDVTVVSVQEATNGEDIRRPPPKTLAFKPGQVRMAVTVTIYPDSDNEPGGIAHFVLGNPQGTAVADGLGVLNVVEDD
jgi:probable HAF family extracellular repeat protein